MAFINTYLRTLGTVETITAHAFATIFTSPASGTFARSVDVRTGCSVHAAAVALAVQPKCTLGTTLQTLYNQNNLKVLTPRSSFVINFRIKIKFTLSP